MNIQPILAANLAVQIHLATVLIAFVASVIIFLSAKGTLAHRRTGRVAAAALVITALASFGINSFDSPNFGLSPIHIFSVVVLFFIPYGVWRARRGEIDEHRRAMTGVAIGGLGVAGAFTLLPGRMMAEVFFG